MLQPFGLQRVSQASEAQYHERVTGADIHAHGENINR